MEFYRQITANNIVLTEYPFRRELAMEAYLIENEEILKLDNQNFGDVTILDAEIALKAGRKHGDGRIDLLAKYSGEYLGIVEIKLNEIDDGSLGQLCEYIEQRNNILQITDEYWSEETAPKWVGILVGNTISNSLREKLSSGYAHKDVPIAGMTIRRFKSPNNEVYVVTDTYFKFNYSSRDFSKFIFEGNQYNKARLVHAVVKRHVENNPALTFADLESHFPKRVQGSFGVFDTAFNANDIYQRWGHKRHYIKPEEEIKLADSTIATCTQWNPYNIQEFIRAAERVGLKITLA